MHNFKVMDPPDQDRPREKLILRGAQNLSDAEKLKANLAFLGIEADIQHVTVNNQAWHRVRSGPYLEKEQLYRDQNHLKKNEIHGITIELK